MRYVDSMGTIQTATNEQMRELDEKEGRVRVPSAVVDATIGMMGAALRVERTGKFWRNPSSGSDCGVIHG